MKAVVPSRLVPFFGYQVNFLSVMARFVTFLPSRNMRVAAVAGALTGHLLLNSTLQPQNNVMIPFYLVSAVILRDPVIVGRTEM